MSNDRTIDTDAKSTGAPNHAPGAAAKRYEKPRLTEYGPLSKITQGASGSTGESGNFTMRMCL
jgi:hypothetical protein